MAKKTDEKVMKMRTELLKKKKELVDSAKPEYKAGEYFCPEINNTRGEFQVSSASLNQLLIGVKSILLHDSSSKILNTNVSYYGCTVDEWIVDFKTRKSVLDRSETIKKIAKLEKDLIPLLTQAQLREIGIGDLEGAIDAL